MACPAGIVEASKNTGLFVQQALKRPLCRIWLDRQEHDGITLVNESVGRWACCVCFATRNVIYA
jgi:hypothetical protein